MAKRLLTQLSPGDKKAVIYVKVHRKWDFTCMSTDDGVKHTNLILSDEQGNAIYAEIPRDDIPNLSPKLEVNGIYKIRRFRISLSKKLYQGYSNPNMIEMSLYTKVEDPDVPVTGFADYIYNLTPFTDIDVRSTGGYFIDVIGVIKRIGDLEPMRLSTTGRETVTRNVLITDLQNTTMKVNLWGDRARDFSIDNVYDDEEKKAVVVLFVGCLNRVFDYVTYLSASSACHWHFNPQIPEADNYYQMYANKKVDIPHPAPGQSQSVQPLPDQPLEHKRLADINGINPYDFSEDGYQCTVTIKQLVPDRAWWYIGCSICKQACASGSTGYFCSRCNCHTTTFMYKLAFIASDGPAEAEFLCFDAAAQRIVNGESYSFYLWNQHRSPCAISFHHWNKIHLCHMDARRQFTFESQEIYCQVSHSYPRPSSN